MYINYLDLLSIKFEGEDGPTKDFIIEDSDSDSESSYSENSENGSEDSYNNKEEFLHFIKGMNQEELS